MTASIVSGSETEQYVAAFETLAAESNVPEWVQSVRRAAFDRFVSLGFPKTKNEDWHYTSVAPIAEEEYTLLPMRTGDLKRDDLAPFAFGRGDWHTMTFVNGRYAPELSNVDRLPAGVRVWDLATAWTAAPASVERVGTLANYDIHSFTALNTAFMNDGAVVEIATDVRLDRPIHLLFVTDAIAAKGIIHPRNLIVLGRNAKAMIVESYVSPSDALYFTNAVTEVSIGEGATLDHCKIQRESRRAFHVGTVESDQARDSHLMSFSFATGGALTRTNIYTTLDGEGAGATLNGLYMLWDPLESTCRHASLSIL